MTCPPAVVRSEFIFETAPFPSCHASTVAETRSGLVAAWWLHPQFADVPRWISRLVAETRSYGFSIYIGRLLSIGTYNMDVLMVAAFSSARSVGFYTLKTSMLYVPMLSSLPM